MKGNCFLSREFLFTSGSCKKNPLSGDYYNEAEAQKVTDVVDDLLKTYPKQLQQTDVAVVASYNDQVIKSKYDVTSSNIVACMCCSNHFFLISSLIVGSMA